MASPTSSDHSGSKVQSCILDSWKLIRLELCHYCEIANTIRKHFEALLGHETYLSSVANADIKETDLYKMHPDISLQLQFSIKREISAEETAINDILKDLQSSYMKIMGQVDKIWNTYREANISSEDLIKESATCLSVAEMLELIDKFKRCFSDSHDGRKYSLDFFHLTKDGKKVLSSWDTAEITSLMEELDNKIL